uniref:Uncharacterized protein n=1 Tax=Strigamia maritima TaxID=126957 RepID=T1IJX2_STRMM
MPEPVNKDKCICQICTCGRHRCPHNPGGLLRLGNDDSEGHSKEYNALYNKNSAYSGKFLCPAGGQLKDSIEQPI